MKNKLHNYLYYGYTGRISKLFHTVFPSITEQFCQPKEYTFQYKSVEIIKTIEIPVTEYLGKNVVIGEISNLLSSKNHPAIIAALVHGSLADETNINYSDFDGILIIDSSKIYSTSNLYSLRKTIKLSHQLMLKQDVLQHHGWQIFFIDDLNTFNENLFPSCIFKTSKKIFGQTNTFKLSIINSEFEKSTFLKLQSSIKLKFTQIEKLHKQYFLKNLISELLLVPSIFLQIKNQKGINKYESFELLQPFLDQISKSTLNNIEQIRLNWNQPKKIEHNKWNYKSDIDTVNKVITMKNDIIHLLDELTSQLQ